MPDTDTEALTASPDDGPPRPATGGPVAPGPERRGPLRHLGILLSVLAATALIGLLAYGLAARSPKRGIDENLGRNRAVAAPGYRLRMLQHGNLGAPLTRPLAPVVADGWVANTELRGTPYVLNFWASWCLPCREEAPLLERTWRRTRPHGVLFLGLDMQDVAEDAHAFLRQFHTNYLNIRDPTNDIARKYGVTGVPETFFVSAHGAVVDHVIGVVTPQQLSTGISAAQAGQPQATRQGGARRPTR